jgi:hypothetical protein
LEGNADPIAPDDVSEASEYEPFSQRITHKPVRRPEIVPKLQFEEFSESVTESEDSDA